jgi:3-oxoacyl-[acyl-carrier protein] reductase
MSDDEWLDVINTNLTGTFRITKLVAKGMLKQKWGRIVNISSISGMMGNPGQANYSASKSGIDGFTRSLAKELGSRNITVNSIAPGFISTDMTEDLSNEDLVKNIPLGRMGNVEDVASLVMFLSSEDANYITGQTLVVDGGLFMK